MPDEPAIPAQPGVYLLLLHVARPLAIEPGRLGRFVLASGWYGYVGSAWGPGGLAARVGRHLRPPNAKRARWHIDWLTAQAPIVQVAWNIGAPRRECAWAQALQTAAAAAIVIPGFGASDCACAAHLLWLAEPTRPLAAVMDASATALALATPGLALRWLTDSHQGAGAVV